MEASKIELCGYERYMLERVSYSPSNCWNAYPFTTLLSYGFIMVQQDKYFITSLGRLKLAEIKEKQ